ncbi:glycosyltransferase PglI [Pseudanabaena sp. lw0831]|uniref:glycosyltransferase family 2 protein n=1 Tax=Pseudanabaena sp. lw0831 TaxID=1357935 RepID=UPI00191577B2|nr:glycosyltransferase family A protein [Pseudanabaena sp. lw0831]GBO51700.1 glycosyltransferase PglI [Pseudanabaena sp. lw0831]
MPFFSVLMPTRNRARLLQESLKSAVYQRFQDYEIIVSDNNSQDNTKEIVMGFANSCDKIKYVNPGMDLSMLDNWEYILNHANGDYIIYLCDDDALTEISLEYIHLILTKFSINIMVWQRAYYHHPDIPDKNLRGDLSCKFGSGNLYELESRKMSELFCDFDSQSYNLLPKILNCVVSKNLIDKCRQKTGLFFLPPFPDYSAACHLLGISSTYHFIDLPIYICGISYVSNAGAQYNRKQKVESYLSLFDRDILENIPYAMKYLTATYLLATQYKFQSIYDNELFKINFDAYFRALLEEIKFFNNYEDISEELELIAIYMQNYYSSSDIFEEITKKDAQKDSKINFKQKLIATAKQVLNINPFLYKQTKKIFMILKGKKDNTTYLYQNTNSMFAASKILGDIILTKKQNIESLKPIYLNSISTIKQLFL